MVNSSIIRLVIVNSLVLFLSACSILPKSPDLNVYQLPQREIQRQSAASVNDVLRVAIPYSRNYLDTQRVVAVTPERSLAVMDGMRWEDLSPIVFRDSLIRALRSAGIYRAVINDDTPSGDYSLRSDLQDFQLDHSVQPAEVVISLDANLTNLKDIDQATNTRSFRARAPLLAESNEAVVEAFAEANHQIQLQIIQWLSTQPRAR
ncbi:MAG: ABC-type transport auxiliary lipoprotein family protein [Alcaligenaceae bacterium]|nr:ABC-type transport auxiliary lipoprotein family protein [Alcaligenaceae bacterium]